MDHILLSDLTAAVKEKLDARAKRVGIPERAYSLEETEPGRKVSLFISGEEGDERSRSSVWISPLTITVRCS